MTPNKESTRLTLFQNTEEVSIQDCTREYEWPSPNSVRLVRRTELARQSYGSRRNNIGSIYRHWHHTGLSFSAIQLTNKTLPCTY